MLKTPFWLLLRIVDAALTTHTKKLIGQGVFKDGSVAAIKVLSADSRQGIDEFLTEINVIANIEHDNLVKLHGCCVEGSHRILVYGYLENNSLAQTLLGNSVIVIS